MRVQHRVNQTDFFAQELQTQLRRRVDEDVAFRRADEDSAAVAIVPRILGTAGSAIAANHGHAVRSTRSKNSNSGPHLKDRMLAYAI